MCRRFLTLLLVAFAMTASAQVGGSLSKDSVIADFRHYVNLLEDTHPDPYTAFGGRVFFHKAANDMETALRRLPSVSVAMLADSIRAFTACLHDGHTNVSYNSDGGNQAERYAYIGFGINPDGLYVFRIDKAHESLLGAALDSVNGQPVGSLLAQVDRTDGCENLYDQYIVLGNQARRETFLRTVSQPADSVRYALTDTAGRKVSVTLPLLSNQAYWATDKGAGMRVPSLPGYPSDNLGYSFVNSEKNIMLLRLSSIMARENYDYCLRNGWANAYDWLRNVVEKELRREMPADTAQALALVPSFSEKFAEMLNLMKANKSENLVIDLRGNGGGWTPITLPSLLMMYGDEYLRKDTHINFARRLSALYLQKCNTTLEEWNRRNGPSYRLGDIVLDTDTTRQSVADFIAQSMVLPATKALLTRLNGQPLYRPAHVYVVTDAYTFSAAFHYAYYLWRMGATLVGVPSCQAPNTFMEQTPFTLPRTGLSGSISNSQQFCFPPDDRRAKVFWPDLMPSRDDYKRLKFDEHTEAIWLLEKILAGTL